MKWSQKAIDQFTEALAAETAGVLRRAIEPLREKVAALEREIATVKASASLRYVGTWESGRTYMVGDAATFAGGLWVCRVAHTATGPQADRQYWQLAVKRGRAA